MDLDIIQPKNKISKAETVGVVCETLWSEPEVQNYFDTMANARIPSEVLKLSNRSDNPMTTPVPDRKISTYAHLFFYGQENCYSLIRSFGEPGEG